MTTPSITRASQTRNAYVSCQKEVSICAEKFTADLQLESTSDNKSKIHRKFNDCVRPHIQNVYDVAWEENKEKSNISILPPEALNGFSVGKNFLTSSRTLNISF